jgi:iron complex outermembrane recepter protein
MLPDNLRQGAIALAVGAAFSSAGVTALAADPAIQTGAIEVIGATPVAGVGVPKSQIPSNVQTVSSEALAAREAQNLPEFMARQLPSVNVNEVGGNPYQPDINYRGFTASPLLGTAQGLSVFLDGVRANEPFGDTVNWDLIPNSAIATLDLIPGSNPLFGLNTLGGALSIHTKNGFTHPGGEAEFSAGSFKRKNAEFSYGGNKNGLGWFMSGDWFKEDGWRDYSDSEVKQFFGKVSHRSAKGEADLSLLRAKTDLIGNGLLPISMYKQDHKQIFTHPDATNNDLTQIALTGKYYLSDATSLSGSLYHRRNTSKTLNGDLNDEYEDDPTEPSGAINRTKTRNESSGAALQWNLISDEHLLSTGVEYFEARFKFQQSAQEGDIDASRGVSNPGNEELENKLHGKTRTSSIFISDTLTLSPTVHLTAAARYNYSHVVNNDQINAAPPNLDADYTYKKLNPAIGITWQIQPNLTAYLGANQGNRIPTPIELGCADPQNPCSLPNAMAADPYLKQVVSRTIEAGFRGKFSGGVQWNSGIYRTVNTDDILFIGAGNSSQGYFTNFGKTQRQGIELGLSGQYRRFDWLINYSYLQAEFKSTACLLAENNSTRDDPACANDEILVKSGATIPGLPQHSLKIGAFWRTTDWLRLGADVQAFSSQYVRGNENNRHQAGGEFSGPGKLPGYGILNLNAEANLGAGWQLFAKVNNVFDKRYQTGGALAENAFAADGSFKADPVADEWQKETFVAPGAPRAAWLGVRYKFNGI